MSSSWIRQDKRLAIYARDGFSCAYCGSSVEDGTKLTLDHLKPRSKGGSNLATNLVTCCHRCNCTRGVRSVRDFCRDAAVYLNHGITSQEIESHIRRCTKRSLKAHKAEAKELISRRGSAARVLSSM